MLLVKTHPVARGIKIGSNQPPQWQSVPTPSFVLGVASNFPPSGTYQSNGYVTDANSDTITITWISGSITGVMWDGGKFVYNGAGSAAITGGLVLRASDGVDTTDSSAFFIEISSGLAWSSTPSFNFVEASVTPQNAGAYVTNYNATTDEFRVTPGYSLPAWLLLTAGPGAGSGDLTPNGTQVDANDIPASPGIKLDVRRSGGAWVSSAAFGVTVTAVGPGTFQFQEIAATPTLTRPYDGLPNSPIIFGKHWAWAYRPSDNRFYGGFGDGGIGVTSGGTAEYMRWSSTTKTLDQFFPQFGITNQPYPIGGDQVHWLYRSANDTFHVLDGYWTAEISVIKAQKSVTQTIGAGQTIEEVFDCQLGGYQRGVISVQSCTAASLPSGVTISSYQVAQINAFGNRTGHSADKAEIQVTLTNANGTPTLVPSTNFTITLPAPSSFSFTATSAQLPTTIAAGGSLVCSVFAPSYAEDTAKWYVPVVAAYAKSYFPGLPAALTTVTGLSKVNYVTGFETGTPRILVFITNPTGSPISFGPITAQVSAGYTGNGYPITRTGTTGPDGYPSTRWHWVYNPTTQVWTQQKEGPLGFPFSSPTGQNEESSIVVYDTDRDCAWKACDGNGYNGILYRYNLDTDVITGFNMNGGHVVDQPYMRKIGQVYCHATREVFAISPWFLQSSNATKILGISTAPGTEGQTRLIASLPPFGTCLAYGGEIPMVLVESRQKILVFTPEMLDFGNYIGGTGSPGTGVNTTYSETGGIFIIDYITGAYERISYPDGVMDGNSALFDPTGTIELRACVQAGYDPVSDVVWGHNKNGSRMLHWSWGGAYSLPAYISSKAINSWIDVPKSRIATSGFGPYQDTPGVNNFPYQTFLDAGLIGGGGFFHAPGYYNSVNFPSGYYGGIPLKNIFGFSGFGFRRASGEIIWAATGGGRDCWNGNDITSIKVFDESPAIAIRVQPSNASQLWPMQLTPGVNNPTATMRDGRPNTSHTYWQTQFIDATDKLLKIGHKQNWQTDDTFFKTVQRWNYGASDWSAAGTEPDLTMSGAAPGFDNFLTVTDPILGDSYMMWNFFQLYKRDNTTGVCSLVPNFGSPPNTATNGGATLDGIRFEYGFMVHWRWNGQHGLFGVAGRIPDHTTTHIWWMFNLTTNQFMNITTVNGDPDVADGANYESFPLAFDYDAGEFYISSGPGTAPFRIWKITPNWTNTISFSSFTPATTYAQPFQEIGIADAPPGYTGPHMWVERGCLIMVAGTRDPFKVIRLR